MPSLELAGWWERRVNGGQHAAQNQQVRKHHSSGMLALFRLWGAVLCDTKGIKILAVIYRQCVAEPQHLHSPDSSFYSLQEKIEKRISAPPVTTTISESLSEWGLKKRKGVNSSFAEAEE